MTPYMVGEVHYYSTEIQGELVLFDCGPPTAEGVAELERSVDLKRLKHLFITHCHVDHYGLAAYIEEHSDARIHFPRHDALRLRRGRDWMAAMQSLLMSAGFDAEYIRGLKGVFEADRTPCPRSFSIAEDSPELPRLGISCLSCPGHSQSDLVYLHERFAVTGDMLLRDIFQSPLLAPDIEELSRRFSNYETYCSSIVKLAGLRGVTILPSHRGFVGGVDETVLFYVRKLLERAGEVKRYSELETAREVVERIFGAALTDPLIIYLKVSEIYFMRDFLSDPARLKQSLQLIGLFGRVKDLYHAVTA
jgi:hydroxyacylglutathione hydrolase